MDIKLHYIEQGAGEPLILLHGNGEDCSYFKRQMDAFAAHYRVIAVDTRGHGRTPRGDAPFTIRQFAVDLHDFMDEMGLQKAHILGFSDGGNIALIFALRWPERVNKLILYGANLNGRGVQAAVQLPIVFGYWAASLFARWDPAARKKAELLGLMVKDPNIPAEALQRVRAQTLVLAGTKDLIRESHTRAIASGIPGAALSFVEGDHFVARRNPNAFNKAVLDFMLQ